MGAGEDAPPLPAEAPPLPSDAPPPLPVDAGAPPLPDEQPPGSTSQGGWQPVAHDEAGPSTSTANGGASSSKAVEAPEAIAAKASAEEAALLKVGWEVMQL